VLCLIAFFTSPSYTKNKSIFVSERKGFPVISTSEFRKGAKILFQNQPYMVLEYHHVKPGKGGAFVRTKMKNMITGLIHEETFRSGEKFSDPDLSYREMQYLYLEDGIYNFMDQETFEQVLLNKNQIEEVVPFLKEQEMYTVLYFGERPIGVTPPMFMNLSVTETQPGFRGDTAQGACNKPATLETGLVIQVPIFVNEGDVIKVDTRESRYIERVK
jgi:elongation factor P